MKWLLYLTVVAWSVACSRPANTDSSSAENIDPSIVDSAYLAMARATGSEGLTVLRGTVRGLGPVSVYLLPKSPDSLGGTLIYPRPADAEGQNAYEVLQVSGKQREKLISLNLGGRFDVRGELRGSLTDNGFRGEWRDAAGIPRHEVQLSRYQLPYALASRTYSNVKKPNPISLDLHVQWTEMVEPSPPHLRDAFNRTVYADAEKSWTSFEKQFEEERRTIGNEELPEYARQRTMDQYDELLYADDQLICLRQLVSIYMGGAHPMWGLQSKVFDVRAARFLEADELFADRRRPLNYLSAYCRPILQKMLNTDSRDPMLQGGTEAKNENFQQLLPTQQGLLVQFNPYEVGPYAVGAPEVLIPWPELLANCRVIPALEAIARAAQPAAGKQ